MPFFFTNDRKELANDPNFFAIACLKILGMRAPGSRLVQFTRNATIWRSRDAHAHYPHAIESTDKWFNMRMYLFSKEHREGLDAVVSFVSLLSELTRSFLFDHSELYVMSNLKKYKRMHSSRRTDVKISVRVNNYRNSRILSTCIYS